MIHELHEKNNLKKKLHQKNDKSKLTTKKHNKEYSFIVHFLNCS